MLVFALSMHGMTNNNNTNESGSTILLNNFCKSKEKSKYVDAFKILMIIMYNHHHPNYDKQPFTQRFCNPLSCNLHMLHNFFHTLL